MSHKHMIDPSEFGQGYRAFWEKSGPGLGRERSAGWLAAAADCAAEEAERESARQDETERRFGLW